MAGPILKILAGLLIAAVVAVLVVLVMPHDDIVAAATPEACHAAAIAAAAKTNPTNVPCDWKKIDELSPGASLNGRYESATAGIQGRMVVMELADRPARLALSTAGESPRYICTAALEAARTGDALVAKPAEAAGCEVTVKSTSTPDVVSVTATDACAVLCNSRGNLGGDFKRMPH